MAGPGAGRAPQSDPERCAPPCAALSRLWPSQAPRRGQTRDEDRIETCLAGLRRGMRKDATDSSSLMAEKCGAAYVPQMTCPNLISRSQSNASRGQSNSSSQGPRLPSLSTYSEGPCWREAAEAPSPTLLTTLRGKTEGPGVWREGPSKGAPLQWKGPGISGMDSPAAPSTTAASLFGAAPATPAAALHCCGPSDASQEAAGQLLRATSVVGREAWHLSVAATACLGRQASEAVSRAQPHVLDFASSTMQSLHANTTEALLALGGYMGQATQSLRATPSAEGQQQQQQPHHQQQQRQYQQHQQQQPVATRSDTDRGRSAASRELPPACTLGLQPPPGLQPWFACGDSTPQQPLFARTWSQQGSRPAESWLAPASAVEIAMREGWQGLHVPPGRGHYSGTVCAQPGAALQRLPSSQHL
ncbi:unnamed protein product, partial [Polarella glacialis]